MDLFVLHLTIEVMYASDWDRQNPIYHGGWVLGLWVVLTLYFRNPPPFTRIIFRKCSDFEGWHFLKTQIRTSFTQTYTHLINDRSCQNKSFVKYKATATAYVDATWRMPWIDAPIVQRRWNAERQMRLPPSLWWERVQTASNFIPLKIWGSGYAFLV